MQKNEDLYEVYRSMSGAIPYYEQLLEGVYNIISRPFLSVADESKRLYFLDMEYKDKAGEYRRHYGNISQEALDKISQDALYKD